MNNNTMVSSFNARFNELCNRSHHNDTELARELHVSKQTLSAWRSGARSPKQPTIIMIAQYFNVSVEWLMGFDVDETKKPTTNDGLTDSQRELIQFSLSLTEEQAVVALRVLRSLVEGN